MRWSRSARRGAASSRPARRCPSTRRGGGARSGRPRRCGCAACACRCSTAHEPFGPVAPSARRCSAEGIVVRKVGEFVGRRQELRLAAARSPAPRPAWSSTASAASARARWPPSSSPPPGWRLAVISLRGRCRSTACSTSSARACERCCSADREQEPRDPCGDRAALRAGDVEWTERWRALSRAVLPARPILVLLDNFEDNLRRDDAAWRVRDPELAESARRWARRPGQSKLLVTSRYPFELPDGAQRRLRRLHLGPLSRGRDAQAHLAAARPRRAAPEERLRAYARRRRAPPHPRVPRRAAARRPGALRRRRRAHGAPPRRARHRGPAGAGWRRSDRDARRRARRSRHARRRRRRRSASCSTRSRRPRWPASS